MMKWAAFQRSITSIIYLVHNTFPNTFPNITQTIPGGTEQRDLDSLCALMIMPEIKLARRWWRGGLDGSCSLLQAVVHDGAVRQLICVKHGVGVRHVVVGVTEATQNKTYTVSLEDCQPDCRPLLFSETLISWKT